MADSYILKDKNGKLIELGVIGIFEKYLNAIKKIAKNFNDPERVVYDEFLSLLDNCKTEKMDLANYYNANNFFFKHFKSRPGFFNNKYHQSSKHDFFDQDNFWYLITPIKITKINKELLFDLNSYQAHQNLEINFKLNKTFEKLIKICQKQVENINTKYDDWEAKYNKVKVGKKWPYDDLSRFIKANPPPKLIDEDLIKDLKNPFYYNQRLGYLLDSNNWLENKIDINNQLIENKAYAVVYSRAGEGRIRYITNNSKNNNLADAKLFSAPDLAMDYLNNMPEAAIVEVNLKVNRIIQEKNMTGSLLHSLLEEEVIEKNIAESNKNKIKQKL